MGVLQTLLIDRKIVKEDYHLLHKLYEQDDTNVVKALSNYLADKDDARLMKALEMIYVQDGLNSDVLERWYVI